jgi:NADH dehydrogenase FAD-containing subunit
MCLSNPLQIVLVGSGELTIAAYKTFAAVWSKQIKQESARIVIVSEVENYECNSLLGEIIAGRLEPQTASMPLAELAGEATIMQGYVSSINNKSKQIQVRLRNGETQELRYDHLVLDNIVSSDRAQPLPAYVHTLNSTEDARLLCRQIDLLVKQAAIARNPLAAKNLLRFVLLVKSAKDIALASFVDHYIAARCSRYYALQAIKPECILVDESETPQRQSTKNDFLHQMLHTPRVTLIQHQKVQRITPEAVVLGNGSFLAAGMIINCNRQASQKLAYSFAENEHGEIITDRFLRVKNESFIWSGNAATNQSRMGKHIAHNIILATECRLLRSYRQHMLPYDGILFPNEAVNSLFGAPFRGRISRHFHLLYLLLQLPSAKMRSNGFVNLISHFLWKKTKIETGLIHYGFASRSNIRAAS